MTVKLASVAIGTIVGIGSALIFATLLGIFILGEHLTISALMGILLIFYGLLVLVG